MEREIKIIGISSQSPLDRINASRYIASKLNYTIGDFDAPIYKFLEEVTGINASSINEDIMSIYLGREWSYVREEKFNSSDGIVFKPVRYHLTPKQIFTKLKYDMRDIHSDFWVNVFFMRYCPEYCVIPVRYPNQADAIIQRDGIVIRINNLFSNITILKEDTIMDGYTCNYTIEVKDKSKDSVIIKPINELLCRIEKENPNAFTIK